ncbi:hypothetical protein LCGC14_0627720 [marine sediment metagenome]|uniref:Uncharacterized protein n=1 Tax=marine sediment metagenome TaxID=412755 RepID=A0A0F9RM93_9ZZZZ
MKKHWKIVFGISCILIGLGLVLVFPVNGNGFNALPASVCFAVGLLSIFADWIDSRNKERGQ